MERACGDPGNLPMPLHILDLFSHYTSLDTPKVDCSPVEEFKNEHYTSLMDLRVLASKAQDVPVR